MIDRRQFCTIIVALFCLFAVATSASAECAWVLWTTAPDNLDRWEPSGAFPSLADCQKKGLAPLRNYPLKDGKFTVSEGSAFFVRQGGKVTQNLACLPDTVDPRGPKGK